jgi:hypothetical protein
MASAPAILTKVAHVASPVTHVPAKVATIMPDFDRVRAQFAAVSA